MALVEVELRDVVVGDRDAQEAQAPLRGERVGGGEKGRAHAGPLVVGVDREQYHGELASADGQREQADELALGDGDEVHAREHVEGPPEHVDVGLAERALAQQRDRFVIGVLGLADLELDGLALHVRCTGDGHARLAERQVLAAARAAVLRERKLEGVVHHRYSSWCPCIRRFCYTATAPLPRESGTANGENP